MHHRLQTVRLGALALLSLSMLATSASAAFDGWAWLEHTPNLHARFEQRTVGKSNSPIGPVAKGELWIRRPGRFRWRYDLPTTQLTLSDGHRVTWYDPQLKQVVIKPATGAMTNALAQLLTSDTASIKHRFQSEQSTEDQSAKLVVTPRNPDQEGFQKITLNWEKQGTQKTLSDITVLDGLGQQISFKLTQVETPSSTALPNTLFNFTPPEGTTVVNEK